MNFRCKRCDAKMLAETKTKERKNGRVQEKSGRRWYRSELELLGLLPSVGRITLKGCQ